MSALASMPDHWQVPAFDVTALGVKQSRCCVVIPVINEGERIRAQLRRMSEENLGLDIIIADGDSADRSTEPDVLRAFGVSTLLTKRGPGRLSAQLRMAFAFALLQGYRGIVTVDGNGKDGTEAIPRFVEALEQGYDFVQGSRYLPGGEALNTPWDREIGVRLVHAPLLSLAARFRYTDTTNGFRAFSARFLEDDRVQPFRTVFDAYNLYYYLAVQAPRLGFRVKELPVRRSYPATGKTPSKISGIKGKLQILKELLLTALGAYAPPTRGINASARAGHGAG